MLSWGAIGVPVSCAACVRLDVVSTHRPRTIAQSSGRMHTRSGPPPAIRIPGVVILEFRMMVRPVLPIRWAHETRRCFRIRRPSCVSTCRSGQQKNGSLRPVDESMWRNRRGCGSPADGVERPCTPQCWSAADDPFCSGETGSSAQWFRRPMHNGTFNTRRLDIRSGFGISGV